MPRRKFEWARDAKLCVTCGVLSRVISHGRCRPCYEKARNPKRREQWQQRNLIDMAHDKAMAASHYAKNRAHRLVHQREYYDAHQAERTVYNAAYHKRHAKRLRAYNRAYRPAWKAKNPGKCAAYTRRWRLANLEESRCARRAQQNRRHAAKRLGRQVEPFDERMIFERDGWLCWLCGLPVLREARQKRDPLMASLDHVVPLARGGQHIPTNVKCSHWRCNLRRGMKLSADIRRERATEAA